MSIAEGGGPAESAGQLRPQADPGEGLERPRRAPGVELLGQMQGTAYATPTWLICLNNSYFQATELLYHVLSHADGETSLDEIARRVTAETSWDVDAEQVRWLTVNRLVPSGLVILSDGVASSGTAAEAEATAVGGQEGVPSGPSRPSQLLGIKHRLPLLPYGATAPVTAVLKYLFWAPLMILVVGAAAAINAWLYSSPDLIRGIKALFIQPGLVLVLFGLQLVGAFWHELGHASALRWARARHGHIGVALYLIVPVFYTDVTHSYRLDRRQRIRVDLGGMYFDLIAMILLYAAFWLTGYTWLLLMIVLFGFKILRQFTPFLRFDGYYVIADSIGVPDPLPLLRPLVLGLVPWRSKQRRISELRPLARVLLLGYLVAVIGFLARPLLILVVAGREILGQLPQSGLLLWSQFLEAWRSQSLILQVNATLQLALWALIPLGLALFFLGLVRVLGSGALTVIRSVYRLVVHLVRGMGRVLASVASGIGSVLVHLASAIGQAVVGLAGGIGSPIHWRPAYRADRRSPVLRLRKGYWLFAVWLAVVLGLGSAAGAALATANLTFYESTAALSLEPGSQGDPGTPSLDADEQTKRLAGALISKGLVQQVLQELQLRDDPGRLLKQISVNPRPGSLVVDVKVRHRDPFNAAAIANRLTADYITQRQAELQQQVSSSLSGLQSSINELTAQITEENRSIAALEALPPRSVTAAQTAQLGNLRQKLSADTVQRGALLQKYENTRLKLIAQYSAVSVSEPAPAPDGVVFRNRSRNMLLAGVLGVTIAIGLAFLTRILTGLRSAGRGSRRFGAGGYGSSRSNSGGRLPEGGSSFAAAPRSRPRD